MSDQHNKNVLGCYGDGVVRTPNLDRLAADGARFTNAYCPAPLCVPSRMSFMTTRNPSANQVWNNGHVLSSGIPTWADYLNWAGYDTALIGRMHFLGPDQRHGFKEHLLGELHPRWEKIPRVACGQRGASVRVAGIGKSAYAWYDERVTDAACQFIKTRARAGAGQPFAATVGFLQPHSPYVAPADLFEYYLGKLPLPALAADLPEQVRRHRRAHQFDDAITPQQARHARAAYYGMCENIDRLIGNILDQLDESGLAENTLVVYCSDHGDMLGERGCWFKSTYYEGSAGVPMIMRWPDEIPAGRTCGGLATLLDLGPTFCAAAGAGKMDDSAGRPLQDLVAGRGDNPEGRPVFSEMSHDQLSHDQEAPEVLPSRMIRSGDWKLWQAVYLDGPQTVMFNLRDDPGELRNLAGLAEYAEVRDQLTAELRRDWEPERVSFVSARRRADVVRLMKGYGGADWEHGGLELCPPPEIESDVELK